jgi:hypothetical protein
MVDGSNGGAATPPSSPGARSSGLRARSADTGSSVVAGGSGVAGDSGRGEPVDFVTGAPITGHLDVRWIHGSPRRRDPGGSAAADPPIQVHAYDPHTFVLRQSKSVHHEAPFLYLFLGNDRALLLDTGATADPGLFPLRATVDGILNGWLADRPRPDYELVVAHTHAHSDHVAGDPQFGGRPATTVVPVDVEAVRAFFGIRAWPGEVEMTRTPRRDYPLGATYQPDEPPLPMTVRQLEQVRDAAMAVAHRPACTGSTTS